MKRLAWAVAAVWFGTLLLRTGARVGAGYVLNLFALLDTFVNAFAKVIGQPLRDELLADASRPAEAKLGVWLIDAVIVALPVLVVIVLVLSLGRKQAAPEAGAVKRSRAAIIRVFGEIAPIGVYLAAQMALGPVAAGWVLLLSTLLVGVGMWVTIRKLPILPLAVIAIRIGLGALTLATGDPRWIQMWPFIGTVR